MRVVTKRVHDGVSYNGDTYPQWAVSIDDGPELCVVVYLNEADALAHTEVIRQALAWRPVLEERRVERHESKAENDARLREALDVATTERSRAWDEAYRLQEAIVAIDDVLAVVRAAPPSIGPLTGPKEEPWAQRAAQLDALASENARLREAWKTRAPYLPDAPLTGPELAAKEPEPWHKRWEVCRHDKLRKDCIECGAPNATEFAAKESVCPRCEGYGALGEPCRDCGKADMRNDADDVDIRKPEAPPVSALDEAVRLLDRVAHDIDASRVIRIAIQAFLASLDAKGGGK